MKLGIFKASGAAIAFCLPALAAAQVSGGYDDSTASYQGGSYGAGADNGSDNVQDGAMESLQERDPNYGVHVKPYIEVSQFAAKQLSPGSDSVTYTSLAGGIDTSIQGRNNGGIVSVRYEYLVGYGSRQDANVLSGLARGYTSIVPQVLTIEAGALATKTRIDGSGGSTLNVLPSETNTSNVYSAYIGPKLQTEIGAVNATAQYQIGYNRIDASDGVTSALGTAPLDLFGDSVTHNAYASLSTNPGDPLPVGLGADGQYRQEDISNLDQRVRDSFVRTGITVPVADGLVLVGRIGYEDVVVSGRDVVRDSKGNPTRDGNGNFVTDTSAPRKIAFQADGIMWDVGAVWKPSTRTSFEAHYGRRYDSDTYFGSFSYAPNTRSALSVNVYDQIAGFGSQLNGSLAALPTNFNVERNSLSGQIGGCISSSEGGQCLNSALASVRSSAFRSRGVGGNYMRKIGNYTAGIGLGYDRRTYLAAQGTALASLDGLADKSYYGSLFLAGPIGRSAMFQTNVYATRLESEIANSSSLTNYGASATYYRNLTGRLSMRAAIALDRIESDAQVLDQTTASGLLGLRYGF